MTEPGFTAGEKLGTMWITMNRPAAMNAITPEVMAGIDNVLDEVLAGALARPSLTQQEPISSQRGTRNRMLSPRDERARRAEERRTYSPASCGGATGRRQPMQT